MCQRVMDQKVMRRDEPGALEGHAGPGRPDGACRGEGRGGTLASLPRVKDMSRLETCVLLLVSCAVWGQAAGPKSGKNRFQRTFFEEKRPGRAL